MFILILDRKSDVRKKEEKARSTHRPRCSSLYRKLASPLQSSVYRHIYQQYQVNKDMEMLTFPTPVGPKNRKDAIGRLGACSPAREIRTASLTAETT